MSNLSESYMEFFLIGHQERLLRNKIDCEELAERALKGEDIHTICVDAAKKAAAPLENDREKRRWLDDYRDEIKEAGGDGNEAFRHFIAGRVFALAGVLESDVIECMLEEDEDDDEEDEEEE